MEPVVDIRDLSVSFGARRVLHGLSLRASPGEITVVIGRSGSGKTTLLRAINRLNELFPSARTEGSIRLRLGGRWIDVNRDRVDTADLRRRAAMVFQSPNVLPVSIARNFAIPLRLALGLGAAAIRERMRKALADADLLEEVEDRLEESALHLSGGQQQRLCLARALALEPEILLVDEPTASLDFKATRRIEALLERLKHRYTILAVSHSLGQTHRLADRCLVLGEGRIVEEIERERLEDPALYQRLVEEIF